MLAYPVRVYINRASYDEPSDNVELTEAPGVRFDDYSGGFLRYVAVLLTM